MAEISRMGSGISHNLRVDMNRSQRRGHDPGFGRIIKAAQKDILRDRLAQLVQRLHDIYSNKVIGADKHLR